MNRHRNRLACPVSSFQSVDKVQSILDISIEQFLSHGIVDLKSICMTEWITPGVSFACPVHPGVIENAP